VEISKLFTDRVEERERNPPTPAGAVGEFLKKREQLKKVGFWRSPSGPGERSGLSGAAGRPVEMHAFGMDGAGKFTLQAGFMDLHFQPGVAAGGVGQVFFLARRWFDSAVGVGFSAGLTLTANCCGASAWPGCPHAAAVIFLGLVSSGAAGAWGAEGGRDTGGRWPWRCWPGCWWAGGVDGYSFGWLILPSCFSSFAILGRTGPCWPWRHWVRLDGDGAVGGAQLCGQWHAVWDGPVLQCANTTPIRRISWTDAEAGFSRSSRSRCAKFLTGTRRCTERSARLGGLVTAFFLVGLLVPFRNPTLEGCAVLCCGCGDVMAVQVMGRTHLTQTCRGEFRKPARAGAADGVDYGVSLFFVFWNSFSSLRGDPLRGDRIVRRGASVPLLFVFFATAVLADCLPPYWPPDVQRTAQWMKESELI